jgi:hypothetical protein
MLSVIDKESLLVMSKAEAIRLAEDVSEKVNPVAIALWSEPIHPSEVELGVALQAIPFHPPIGGVGEDEGSVLRLNDVVGAVELFVTPVGSEDGNGAIELGAGHPARVMLAGNEAPLLVIDIAIPLVAGLTEGGNPTPWSPLPHVIPRHIAEDQMLLVRMPYGTLREDEPGPELLDLGVGIDDLE